MPKYRQYYRPIVSDLYFWPNQRCMRTKRQALRKRSDALFKLPHADSFYDRSIPERHRFTFCVCHLEAFDWDLLRESTLGLKSFNHTSDRVERPHARCDSHSVSGSNLIIATCTLDSVACAVRSGLSYQVPETLWRIGHSVSGTSFRKESVHVRPF